MQRFKTVEADETAGLASVAIDDAHRVDRLADFIECSEIVVGREIGFLARAQQHRFGAHDVAPFFLETFDELRPLLEDVRQVSHAAGCNEQRHVAHEFVKLVGHRNDTGRHPWNVVSELRGQQKQQDYRQQPVEPGQSAIDGNTGHQVGRLELLGRASGSESLPVICGWTAS